MNLKTLRTATMIAAITGVAGCAVLPKRDRWVSVKPVQSTAQQESGIDGDYAAAVSAISRRDYAQALDMLQAANARKIDDVRVLNAFGVVYDKLGRFDLSARYYARARA
jgi:Flp pilus assembly protein TadD